jgi:lysophospholipase L1-like esterase
LILGLGLLHLAPIGAPSAVAAGVPTKVMALGDSITDGYNVPGGYRIKLRQNFLVTGQQVDFVGSKVNGPPELADKEHEGYSGFKIHEIDAAVTPSLDAYRPEVVLLLAGTNDMIPNFNVGTAPARLSALIDKILGRLPSTRVMVATLPPLGDPAGNQRVAAFNQAIPGVVNAKVSQGKPVSLVNVHAALGVADLADGIHPTLAGYNKMADAWHQALASVLTVGSGAWYFAEGYTGPGFDQYLTIQNPNPIPAQLRLTYYLNGGAPVVKGLTAPANSRYTVAVHDEREGVGRNGIRGWEVSAKVESTNGVGIVAERPMYFTYNGATISNVTGGHNVMGVNEPRASWLFAEGYTGPGFDEYLTIQNPNATDAAVAITYFLDGAPPVTRSLVVPASSRRTVTVHASASAANPGGYGRTAPGQGIAAHVATTNPGGIVAERPMYFRYGAAGVPGGHVVLGAAEARPVWSFPDGNTGGGYEEYLTIMNPSGQDAQVVLTYYTGGGSTQAKSLVVPASSRRTVTVHDPALGVGRGLRPAVTVASANGVGLVVERPIYTPVGGDDALGAADPRPAWLFGEGFTGAGFAEELVILNPAGADAAVTISYQLAGGATVTKAVTAPARSRRAVDVNGLAEGVGPDQAVSARVSTTSPAGIVVERAITFTYLGATPGYHAAMGYAP